MNANKKFHDSRSFALGGIEDALVAMVDDEPLVIELTQAFLEEAGFKRFVSTSDSTNAIAMLLSERPDVLLLDINMPQVTGLDVLAAMQSHQQLMHLPAIILTSVDDAETKLKALDLGASDFLRKPVDPSELALRLRNTLSAQAYREGVRKAFTRYVSPNLVDRIINQATPFSIRPQRTEVVVLFADLRGFTRMTELLGVEQIVEKLNQYFEVITEVVYQHEGTIFNMAGDSLLVGFNVPFPQPDAAVRAWRAAREMQLRFGAVAESWRTQFGIATGVGIGMCRGETVIGNVGSHHFMSYTVIGNTVNIAARLMQMAGINEVLIPSSLYAAISEFVPAGCAESRGQTALRGSSEMMELHAIRL